MGEGEREYLSSWKVESGLNIARRNNFTEVIDQRGRKGKKDAARVQWKG